MVGGKDGWMAKGMGGGDGWREGEMDGVKEGWMGG
jgi:hypothetical protein